MDLIDCPAMLCWWIKVWRNQFFHLKLAAEYGWNYAISKANDWVKTRVGKLPKCPQFREKVVTVSWIFADSWCQHVVDTPGSLPANPTVNGIPSELCRTCLQGPRSPPTRTMQQHDSFPKSWHTPFFSQKKIPRSFGWMSQAEHLIARTQQHLGFETRFPWGFGGHRYQRKWLKDGMMGLCWRPCWLFVWLLL